MTRTILTISGSDRTEFLQNLVTNDVTREGLVYAALLTPQGKYLADFFLLDQGGTTLLDVDSAFAPGLAGRLSMYKLRADVAIAEAELFVHVGTDAIPADGHADPRDADLGWRAYRDHPQGNAPDLTPLRIAKSVPESGQDLTPDSYILEMGFERLNGVDFKKGCYVGQEVTARMKHKTELRKGLARVTLSEPVEAGTEITSGGKAAGHITSVHGTEALAYLRFDRAKDPMTAGPATVALT